MSIEFGSPTANAIRERDRQIAAAERQYAQRLNEVAPGQTRDEQLTQLSRRISNIQDEIAVYEDEIAALEEQMDELKMLRTQLEGKART